MDDRLYLDRIFELLSYVGKGVSSPKRIELLVILAQGPRTVEVLSHEANMTIANTSQHLRVLQKAHMVDSTKRGLFVTYRITNERVLLVMSALHQLAEHSVPDMMQLTQAHLSQRKVNPCRDQQSLRHRIHRGEVTLLDVRPREEFEAGHLDGAISVPLHTLNDCLSSLPREQEYAVYCRGPYSVLSIKAAALMQKRGYVVFRLITGICEWRDDNV